MHLPTSPDRKLPIYRTDLFQNGCHRSECLNADGQADERETTRGAIRLFERTIQRRRQNEMAEMVYPETGFPIPAQTRASGTGHDAGIVDEEVQRIVIAQKVIGKLPHRIEIGEIERRRFHRSGHVGKRLLRLFHRPDWNNNLGARGGENSRRLKPDAGITACHNGGFFQTDRRPP